MEWIVFIVAAAALATVYWLWHAIPKWRFTRAMRGPFPATWLDILQQLPIYRWLEPQQQDELRTKVRSFIYHKRFVGCEGLTVTDEMRVTIAAEACLLILNRPSTEYDRLRWIYIFPTGFRERMPRRDEHGLVSEPRHTLLGVSWSNGRVVLSWDSVVSGSRDFTDGHNVVLHEFAHQLDQEDGSADGAPLLYTRDAYRVWSEVLGAEFEQLRQQAMAGEDSLLDQYGATNAAEFFAVATELFYERPLAMSRTYPELYTVMQDYYRVDPRVWQARAGQVGLVG